jgi:hypothetical protein
MTTIADYIASASINIRNSQFISTPEFFRSQEIIDNNFFDDSYRKVNQYSYPMTGSINTGSIDTSQFDAHRQGIELTHVKYWDAGLVKIHVGEPGHVKRQNSFGILRREYEQINSFIESHPVDAAIRVKLSITSKTNIDNSDVSFDANGCIEPLTIRDLVSFRSVFKDEPHTTRGTFMQGNEYDDWSSDLIVSTQDFVYTITQNVSPFYDVGNMIGGFKNVQLNFMNENEIPYDDSRVLYRENSLSDNMSTLMSTTLLQLQFDSTGSSTDKYIREGHVASTTGWTYFSNVDSIAFGDRLQ